MSKLTQKILPKNFELIRDKIGEILVDELANQITLGSDVIEPTAWVERVIAFDKEEVPAINVVLSKGNFDSQNQYTSLGTYTYFIDLYNKAKFSGIGVNKVRGDEKSSKEMQRLIGVVYGILESAHYNTLGFAPPLIRHTEISDFNIAEPENADEAINLMFGRIIFMVNCNETAEGYVPVVAEGYDTQVKLEETDKGFKYTINN